MADWSRTIDFRGREATIYHSGDGDWWINDIDGNTIDDLTTEEVEEWGQYVYEWRSSK